MNTPTIAFVGAGNMARSIIGGLVQKGFSPDRIVISNPSSGKLEALASQYGVRTSQDNLEAVKDAHVIVLSVKPQIMKAVCLELQPAVNQTALIVSVAAGITCESLNRWLGGEKKIVRCMPNTPALVQQGATGLFAPENVSAADRQQAEAIVGAIGTVAWVSEEDMMDTVTAVSGSGPAYFFLFLEAMVESAVQQGLAADVARQLAIQTAMGAAQLAQNSDVDLAELRRRVTSPGGTTEKAIEAFEQGALRQLVHEAMLACANRSREMAEQLGS